MSRIISKLFEQAEADFAHHVLLENNKRIIFSGAFGTGKTTFLNYFFDVRKTEYNVIRLAPVNYVISSNEDILRYIKYDILRSLIESGRLSLNHEKFKLYETLPFFIETEYPKLVRSILFGISKVKLAAEGLATISKDLTKIANEIVKHNTEFNKTENALGKDFIRVIENQEGSLYENNIVTELINSGLEDHVRENVLIIDDLDRIDPGHIFRLLNVFAAHIDNKEEGSKFGFDKIILVCDINNIRNIFSTKYGSKTDFNGYIDKFYSRRVHYFDNRRDLRVTLHHCLKEIHFDNNNNLTTEYFRKLVEDELYSILEVFISKGLCNLRSILRFERFNFRDKKIFIVAGRELGTEQIISAMVIDLLIGILGDKDRLMESLELCIEPDQTMNQVFNSDNKLKHVLMLSKIRQHKHVESKFTINDLGIVIDFEVVDYGRGGICWAKNVGNQGFGNTAVERMEWNRKYNFFNQYIEGLKILQEVGALG